ncbi:hypothetical protein ASG04_12560 [Curtobacterium sp. Leaf183]|uniref:hypothetical protein n=1 Tax=Curtobacterium sp. Leaf183 TaxID=1736291 RepID=UPI0006F6E1FD|nr:hypothetical protein [Curtobacterium sp. Leaf183]KQS07978.1 hypothetical protein ASG04_12560 [Curtobacterium sp. Leaf183]
MRVLAFLVTIVVTTALALGAGLLIALHLGRAPDGLLVSAAAASPFLVFGPLVVGSWTAYFDDRTPSGRSRYLRRAFLVVVAVDVAAAVVVVVASTSAQAPVWVPAVLVGGSAILFVVARPIGSRFRRLDTPMVELRDQVLPGPDVIRRKVVRIGITFVVAAIVSSVGTAVLNVLDPSTTREALVGILLAGQLTFLATAFASIIVALPFSRLLRDAGGRDLDRLRRYAKLVLRGRAVPLEEAEKAGAVRYAQVIQVVLQFNTAYVTLLYVSIAFQFVSGILRGNLVVFSVLFLVFMVVVLAWLLPRTVIRVRRARRYVEEHPSTDAVRTPETSIP